MPVVNFLNHVPNAEILPQAGQPDEILMIARQYWG
jgi:hypothetical protein